MSEAHRYSSGATDRIETLTRCCIGSRASLFKLLQDRQSIGDEDLRRIIDRLDAVLAEESNANLRDALQI